MLKYTLNGKLVQKRRRNGKSRWI